MGVQCAWIRQLLPLLGICLSLALVSASPTGTREMVAAESNGYGGREVIILDESNGYGQHGGGHYGGGGGYGGYGYDPIVVHIPNSEPYYPGYMPLYSYGYTQPAHTPHYESNYY